ncbi:hypothetical protein [Virgisporangium aurantiacum]|uniref:Uncharacterized protein n=1 Tax=Virgisporangium aurantiacum TaxID=175570 RepID=A0A8J3ZJM6_9ACTN|nr:hypothetical protein [Virgisporangium aurantiacum]GIJ62678.1 hypothetical protein Vau01_101940 [Virgisporangium aurantiacum]
MRSDVAAAAVTINDRGSSHDICTCAPPDLPRRRRWGWLWPGTGFLDRPGGSEYANRWQSSCGQGG